MNDARPLFWFCVLTGLTQLILHDVLLHPVDAWNQGIPALDPSLGFVLASALWIFFAAVVVSAVVATDMRPASSWHWIALLPLPALSVLVGSETPDPILSRAYLVLTVVAWSIFVWSGRVASAYFLIWIAVCIALILALHESLFCLVIFVVATLTGRLICTFITENYGVFRELTRRELVVMTLQTAKFFIPILAVAIGWNVYFGSLIRNSIVEELYASYQDLRDACKPQFPDDLRDRVSCLIDNDNNKRKKAVDDSFAKLPSQASGAVDEAKHNILDGFDKAYPSTIDLGSPDSCHSFDLGPWLRSPCDHRRHILNAIEEEYAAERERQRRAFVERIDKLEVETKGELDKFVSGTRSALDETVEAIRSAQQSAAREVFHAADAVDRVATLLLVLAATRGFVMIFSRVCLTKSQKLNVQLPSPFGAVANVSANIMLRGSRYAIATAGVKTVYSPVRHPVDGRPENIRIPQWKESAITRILCGAYVCNKNEMDKNLGSIIFRTTLGSEFVQWNIVPEEEVVFDPKTLVAFEEGIHFRTITSLRLSTLVLGRIFFCCARGEGLLILKTRGKPEIGNAPRASRDVRVSQLVAWQTCASFKVKSTVDFSNIYLGGVSVAKDITSHAVIDVPPPVSTARRIVRIFRSFLLPV